MVDRPSPRGGGDVGGCEGPPQIKYILMLQRQIKLLVHCNILKTWQLKTPDTNQEPRKHHGHIMLYYSCLIPSINDKSGCSLFSSLLGLILTPKLLLGLELIEAHRFICL